MEAGPPAEGAVPAASLRWGLYSTARINDRLLAAELDVVAVGSRDAARAREYAEAKGIARAHGSYAELLADDAVDAVYVSTPNGRHVEDAIAALQAGKHVLCEKPLARTAEAAGRAFDAAEAAGRVLTEAFMWRFQPQTERVLELVRSGALGELRAVDAAFAFPLEREGDPRWDPEQDGGALMDVGCYCVSALRLLCGEPEEVHAVRRDAASRVDVAMAATLRFPGDVLGTLRCGFDFAERGLRVVGSEASLFVEEPWFADGGLWVDGERSVVPKADAYRLEALDLERAVAAGGEARYGRADAVDQAALIERLYAACA